MAIVGKYSKHALAYSESRELIRKNDVLTLFT